MGSLIALQSLVRKRCVRLWIPTLLVVVILLGSPSLSSSANTEHLLRWLLAAVWPEISTDRLIMINHLARKVGHVAGYGLLGVLFLRSWWATLCLSGQPSSETKPDRHSKPSRWRVGVSALAFLSTVTIASLDEWQQSVYPDRTAKWTDVALDSMAAVVVLTLILFRGDMHSSSCSLKPRKPGLALADRDVEADSAQLNQPRR